MKQLKRLSLGWTQVDDAGLEIIAGFPQLESLKVYQAKVTDAGMVHLGSLKNLKVLSVSNTAVTPQAIEELKRSLPTLTNLR